MFGSRLKTLGFEFDVHAGRKIEVHERVHRLRRGLEDIDEPLVRAHLEVLERCTQNRLISVGNGTGPLTNAPVRFAVSTIRSAD
jgi:hypothetical protein